MTEELTRIGGVGLELTREEVIDLKAKCNGLLRKAQCREVNCDVIDKLGKVVTDLDEIDNMITDILENNYEG